MAAERVIHTILLIPNDGDPLGLLAEGACGARPPRMAFDDPGVVGFPGRWSLTLGHGRTRALVLAYAGQAVPEGCDRLDAKRDIRPMQWRTTAVVRDVLSCHMPIFRLREDTANFGHLVFLDADGKEMFT